MKGEKSQSHTDVDPGSARAEMLEPGMEGWGRQAEQTMVSWLGP